MKRFAALLDRLILTPSRNSKLHLLEEYFRGTPDPDRGFGLAALTGELDLKTVKPAMLRALVSERVDAALFELSYDYVGDLAETIALIWEEEREGESERGLGEVVHLLQHASRSEAPGLIKYLLNTLEASSRYALLKLATGGLRIGISSRLAKQALANLGTKDISEIEELWHGLKSPYQELFAWLEGQGEKPVSAALSPFRPVMLSHAVQEGELNNLNPSDYVAEWKWDGIRVQVTCERGVRRIYSRTGEEISGAFPDLTEHMNFDGSLDGELLVKLPSNEHITVGSFGDLQQRLNRKTVSKKMLADFPVFLRAYDILQDGDENTRSLPFLQRRNKLERFISALDARFFDLSPLIPFDDWTALEALRSTPPHPVIEGVMIKRKDSPYLAGRPKGPWFKWKKDPYTIDAVLMYAQRGHGKRSSFYSDYTFGVWNNSDELVPVGKAYFGFTDLELKQIDKYVRDNTIERFGPVRSVRADKNQGLVLEIAFEGLNRSTRHKSGVAMRFPRISRLRWDKPTSEADRLQTLETMLA